MRKVIGIVGIHTDIGKTVASAVLAEALDADYWKPVQAGNLVNSDRRIVESLLTDGNERTHAEAVLLTEPMSPHAAAVIDKKEIDHRNFVWPQTDKLLLVETAGGLLSPMYEGVTMADFVQHYKLPVILVSQNYLGSINHTLLCVEVLKERGIEVLGIVMSGETNQSSEDFIEQYGKVPIIARIPQLEPLNNETVRKAAESIKPSLTANLKHAGY